MTETTSGGLPLLAVVHARQAAESGFAERYRHTLVTHADTEWALRSVGNPESRGRRPARHQFDIANEAARLACKEEWPPAFGLQAGFGSVFVTVEAFDAESGLTLPGSICIVGIVRAHVDERQALPQFTDDDLSFAVRCLWEQHDKEMTDDFTRRYMHEVARPQGEH